MKKYSLCSPCALVPFVLLVGLACQAAAGPASTEIATQAPTAAPAATRPPAPTHTPAATGTQTGEPAPFAVSRDLYRHPSGSFSFYPPEGWELTETEFYAAFKDPSDNNQVQVYVTNTGSPLEQASFASFANATEASFYAAMEGYDQISNEYDSSTNSIQIAKSLSSAGEALFVDSVYYQVGQAIIEVTFWMTSPAHLEAYSDLLADLQIEEAPVAGMRPYSLIHTFVDRNDHFQFDVPNAWKYESIEEGAFYYDRFAAPDDQAIIDSIVYDTGQPMNQSAAGDFALQLLNTHYTNGAGDIKISKDEPQPDGSEKLTWSSQKGGYSGVSIFRTRETTLLLLTLLANSAMLDVFDPTFDYVIATYRTP